MKSFVSYRASNCTCINYLQLENACLVIGQIKLHLFLIVFSVAASSTLFNIFLMEMTSASHFFNSKCFWYKSMHCSITMEVVWRMPVSIAVFIRLGNQKRHRFQKKHLSHTSFARPITAFAVFVKAKWFLSFDSIIAIGNIVTNKRTVTLHYFFLTNN